jgi:DNA-binding transcriptional ArsR family regulator
LVNGRCILRPQNASKDSELNDDEALKILVALGDPGRFEIFRRVGEAPGLSSSDLKFGKSASTTSHHIKLLVDAGVLETARHGKHVRYNVHRGTLASFAKWAGTQAELATLNQLAEYLSDNPS